jgi:transposase
VRWWSAPRSQERSRSLSLVIGFCSTMKGESDSLWFMSKTFRPWDVEQRWLLPPSLHELVPAGHVAHIVRETVCKDLKLDAILSAYTEERGFPPYHPVMMVALLLYSTAGACIPRARLRRLARSGWTSWR